MSIAPVTAVTAVTPAQGLAGTGAVTAPASDGSAFASVLGSVDSLQQMQATTDGLAVQAVTGDLDDVHDYTIAAAQSSLAIELTAAVRNKAVEAFSEIMRMQA
jgi:flagellar hook-basal body complex protein FliE